MVCITAVMMRLPPGVPRIIHGLPLRVTIVGVIELSGRLPGSILLVSLCTRPYMFATPALAVKSSISLLSRTPVPAAVTRAPNQSLSV